MARAYFLAGAEEERLRYCLNNERRLLREASAPLQLPENEFRAHFRLTKTEYLQLCSEVIPLLPPPTRSTAVRPEIKILAAVAFYANGCYQKNIGSYYHLGLSQTVVSDSLRDVTNAINTSTILKKYIYFPKTEAERQDISVKFMDKFGFPGVLGCIDGTHIAIIRPTENEETYFNRKYYHSLNVLVICDADMRITYVNAGFGGASHDSHIWNSCPVLSHLQRLHSQGHQYWLLGDSAYAQRPWMMQPILNAERNTPEEYYTQVHVRTRNIVERCFGVLKTRWRCLLSHRVLHYDPVKAAKIVNACVVLHNLVVDKDIDVDFEEIARDRELQPARIAVPLEGGAEMRRAMVNRLWISRNR